MRISFVLAVVVLLGAACEVGIPDETSPDPDDTASIAGLGGAVPSSESTVPTRFQNLSTRVRVESGDRVAIAGIIIGGSGTKRVVVRALGPSLAAAGITSPLPNPALELRDAVGGLVASSDDWRTNQAEIDATGLSPSDDREAAVVVDVAPGSYTAIVRGADGSPGTALVETYDIEPGPIVSTRFQNMSTRGIVGTGDDVAPTAKISVGLRPQMEWTRNGTENAVDEPFAMFTITRPGFVS